MRRLIPLPLVLTVVALAGCGGGNETASIPSADATTATGAASGASGGSCRTVSDPGPKRVSEKRPTAKLRSGVDYTVTLQTSCGTIPILLDQGRQPRTAASFAHLVSDGVFDRLTFHRIVPGFVIQGGDPDGTGEGSAGYSITETPPRDARYTRGVVAMAKTPAEPAGTGSSQFFIVVGDDAQLPPDYAIVGKVTGDGMAVADRIAAVEVDGQDVPVSPVVIEKATLAQRP